MDLNNIRATMSTVCWALALILALSALLKMFDLVVVRGSILDLCAVSIALALAK